MAGSRSTWFWASSIVVGVAAVALLAVVLTRQECVDRRLALSYMAQVPGSESLLARPKCPLGFYVAVNEKSTRFEATCGLHGALRPDDVPSAPFALPPGGSRP